MYREGFASLRRCGYYLLWRQIRDSDPYGVARGLDGRSPPARDITIFTIFHNKIIFFYELKKSMVISIIECNECM